MVRVLVHGLIGPRKADRTKISTSFFLHGALSLSRRCALLLLARPTPDPAPPLPLPPPTRGPAAVACSGGAQRELEAGRSVC